MMTVVTAEDIKNASSAAEAAAMWWANALHSPRLYNGDTSEASVTGMKAALILQSETQPSEDALVRFRDLLKQKIENKLESSGDLRAVQIVVDYFPDQLLSQCAEESGLGVSDIAGWPWKTYMWVEPYRVRVNQDYGPKPQIVWEKLA
jgi:hypothetical protein